MRKWMVAIICGIVLGPPHCGGLSLAAASAAPVDPQVRVGLRAGASAAVVGPDWLGQVQVADSLSPEPVPPAEARWLAAQALVAYDPVWTPGGVVVPGGAHRLAVPAQHAGSTATWRIGAAGPETGPALRVGPFAGAFDAQPYRGVISATVDASGVTVVNTLPLEAYLRGVVPAEMPAGWPLAALQAQAVAARTFTLKNLGRRAALGFDLYADTRDQAYGGIAVETPATDTAVESTRGQVLTYDGQLIDAVYSANAGGQTASAEETWGRAVPYLPSTPLPEEPEDRWAAVVPVEPLLKAFPELGGSLTSAGRGPVSASGRIRSVILRGAGTVHAPLPKVATAAVRSSRITSAATAYRTVVLGSVGGVPRTFTTWTGTGPSFWTVVGTGDMQAVWPGRPGGLYLAGTGFGHGVGLSQWGAYALARQGWTYREILHRFYPPARLQQTAA